MRIDVQWTTDPPGGYVTLDHTEWPTTPVKRWGADGVDEHEGYIAHIAISGVRMPQADIYAIEPHPEWIDGVRVSCWSVTGHGDTARNHARVWEFAPPYLDLNAGRVVPPQRQTWYLCPSDECPRVRADGVPWRTATPYTSVVGDEARRDLQDFADFTPPAPELWRYGVTISDELYAEHAVVPWTDLPSLVAALGL